jgi:hypothetical protein
MVEKDRCLRAERGGQGSQGQIGDAMSHHVVDGPVKEFLSALRIRWSAHQPALRWRGDREGPD